MTFRLSRWLRSVSPSPVYPDMPLEDAYERSFFHGHVRPDLSLSRRVAGGAAEWLSEQRTKAAVARLAWKGVSRLASSASAMRFSNARRSHRFVSKPSFLARPSRAQRPQLRGAGTGWRPPNAPARDITSKVDAAVLYRARAPTRQGRRKYAWTRKVENARMSKRPVQQVVMNKLYDRQIPENKQVHQFFPMYGADGDNGNDLEQCGDIAEIMNNLYGARSTEGEAWDSAATRHGKVHFTSCITEYTFVNRSQFPLILELYDWYCHTDVAKTTAATLTQLYLRGFHHTAKIKNEDAEMGVAPVPPQIGNPNELWGSFDTKLEPDSVYTTPFHSPALCSHIKIKSKKRYVLPINGSIHIFRKDTKNRVFTQDKFQGKTALKGHTQGIMINAYGETGGPSALVLAQAARLAIAEIRYYSFKSDVTDKRGAAYEYTTQTTKG